MCDFFSLRRLKMPKRERPTSEEFGVETKRSKKVKYAQLTSNPTGYCFIPVIVFRFGFFA